MESEEFGRYRLKAKIMTRNEEIYNIIISIFLGIINENIN